MSGVLHRAAQTENPPIFTPRMKVSLKGCVSRSQTMGGGIDIRPPTVQTRESSKVVRRGGGGVVPDGVSPRGVSPGGYEGVSEGAALFEVALVDA